MFVCWSVPSVNAESKVGGWISNLFSHVCFKHNLVDFSLQFADHEDCCVRFKWMFAFPMFCVCFWLLVPSVSALGIVLGFVMTFSDNNNFSCRACDCATRSNCSREEAHVEVARVARHRSSGRLLVALTCRRKISQLSVNW